LHDVLLVVSVFFFILFYEPILGVLVFNVTVEQATDAV